MKRMIITGAILLGSIISKGQPSTLSTHYRVYFDKETVKPIQSYLYTPNEGVWLFSEYMVTYREVAKKLKYEFTVIKKTDEGGWYMYTTKIEGKLMYVIYYPFESASFVDPVDMTGMQFSVRK